MNKRIAWIDFAKGFTIFIVLLAHALKGANESRFNSIPIKAIIDFLIMFSMPVFFALSGFLYKRINNKCQYFKSIKKKFIGLFIPYLVFSIVYVTLQHLAGSSVHNLMPWSRLLYIWATPINYLWFLYVLFFIFVLVGFMDLLKINSNVQLLIYFLLIIISQIKGLPWVIGGPFMWTFSFYLGFFIKNNLKMLNNRLVIYLMLLVSLVVFYIDFNIINLQEFNAYNIYNFIPKIFSIIICFYFYSKIKTNGFFNYFSKYGPSSMVIYMVSEPIESVVRTLLFKINLLSNMYLIMFLLVTISWFLSIFVCYLSKKSKIIGFIFFPNKFIINSN